eukprot:c10860_g1_i1.p1 GENE.c10860_g1_i1~~c10860_g1_i1.p1  ORF type:complete len:471 (+),score=114.92 c10860_g1_i1:46-1413(+)
MAEQMRMFRTAFALSVVGTAAATLLARKTNQEQPSNPTTSAAFTRFKWTYLVVYLLAMTGDWLQGPYVYALYDSYGFSQHDIAILFVAGFGSSFLFGTFVGSLADRYGRKKWTVLFCILYTLSCFTKHVNNFSVLMLGRVLGGISTSLLFSVFESWMVKAHNDHKFPMEWMNETFSIAMFGNSLVAILAGITAQQAADLTPLAIIAPPNVMFGGFCSPFDLAAICLVIAGLTVSARWTENYGDHDGTLSALSPHALINACNVIFSDKNVLLTGLIQSLFEGSMYTFVFMWTPAMTDDTSADKPPYGLIFATFMVACMGGSSLFSLLSAKQSVHLLLPIPMFVSAVALSAPILTKARPPILFAFIVFEACVGLYFPIMGTVKSRVVPEGGRSAIYNLFRVPLNIIVLCVLLTDISVETAMMCCTGMLFLAGVLSLRLSKSVAVYYTSQPLSMTEEV